jgi:hypothetical protein
MYNSQTSKVSDGEILVSIMSDEGVDIDSVERQKVISDIDEAILNNRLIFIKKNNTPIGFVTYKPKINCVFISYCFVYRKYRNVVSLLGLRKIFRNIGSDFRWKSRRRGRYCEVK